MSYTYDKAAITEAWNIIKAKINDGYNINMDDIRLWKQSIEAAKSSKDDLLDQEDSSDPLERVVSLFIPLFHKPSVACH